VPTWRIDIAGAKFSLVSDPIDRLVIYCLPQDLAGAQRILKEVKKVVELYSSLFSRPKLYAGYTIIEIPDGLGSQASDLYVLQTPAAFTDSTRIGEMYHEVAHTWNAMSKRDVQRCRWFDEAFASYLEALAIFSFYGRQAFEDELEKSREIFVRWANYDRQVYDTPIADHGKKELGRHSYTKGAWSLYVLNQVVGDQTFTQIFRAMLAEYETRAMDFDDFRAVVERISKRNLKKFFDEWIYGTESSRLLVDGVSITDIVKRY
jgi:aminopeptidase N